MEELSGVCRVTGVLNVKADEDHEVKFVDNELTPTQRQVFQLLKMKSLC